MRARAIHHRVSSVAVLATALTSGALVFAALPAPATGLAGGASMAVQQPDWAQWAGPSRDWKVPNAGLAEGWPEAGPEELWRRPLGEGYSGIAMVDGRLFTMTRRDAQEVVVALDATTGDTLWEHAYDAPRVGRMDVSEGAGPHAAPLIAGGRVFTIGATGLMRALDLDTGELRWSQDLWGGLSGTFRPRGYSSSPMAHGDTVIALVGGTGRSVVAFRQDSGEIAWQGGDFDNGHASPIVIDVDGQEQVVAFMASEVAGIETSSGRTLWSVPHTTSYELNISTPVWGPDNVLLVSSAYSGGSRAMRLSRDVDGTVAEELWFTNRMRVHFGTIVRLGELAYGSSGDFGPAFLCALDVSTGEVLWQDRSFSKASFVYAGDRLVVLDEDGTLALAALGPEGVEIIDQTQIFDARAWTAPTLVGTRLYARNRREIVAFELGTSEAR